MSSDSLVISCISAIVVWISTVTASSTVKRLRWIWKNLNLRKRWRLWEALVFILKIKQNAYCYFC